MGEILAKFSFGKVFFKRAYNVRNILKKYGFRFDSSEKAWYREVWDEVDVETVEKVISLIEKEFKIVYMADIRRIEKEKFIELVRWFAIDTMLRMAYNKIPRTSEEAREIAWEIYKKIKEHKQKMLNLI